MTSQPSPVQPRDELLELAATMFAERGLRATTVRDIADSAGILSGSLYHHFESKEEMVDEVLRDFLDWLFARYQEIVDTEPNPLERLKGLFMASFEAIEHRHAAGRDLPGRGQAAVVARRSSPIVDEPQQRATQDVGRRAQPGHRGGLLPARHRR